MDTKADPQKGSFFIIFTLDSADVLVRVDKASDDEECPDARTVCDMYDATNGIRANYDDITVSEKVDTAMRAAGYAGRYEILGTGADIVCRIEL